MARASFVAALLVAALAMAGCTELEKGPNCSTGQEFCAGICRDPASFQTDPANCSACGVSCGIGTCVAGVCQCEGATPCPSQNPRCADLQNDPANCGACGAPCTKPGEGCAGGVCGCFPPRADDCGAFCTNVLTDPEHCGSTLPAACTTPCPLDGDVCVGGACQCPASRPDTCPAISPQACVNLATDGQNCGACGRACTLPGKTLCASGDCACLSGLSDCGSGCFDLQADEGHCGACGTVCPATATCTSGSCACPAGPQLGCGGNCCPGGDACCGGTACQPEHSNGLGQPFFHCNALTVLTLDSATAAAKAWRPTGAPTGQALPCLQCFGWQTGSACAVWCFGDVFAGHVRENTISQACICPSLLDKTWN